jgi:hypothetical protein
MPFDENKLKSDFTNALGIPIPDGEDAAMATVAEIGGAMAKAVGENPGITVFENEERIITLMDELAALTSVVGDLEKFTNAIEQRIAPIEETVSKLDPSKVF